MKEYSIYIHIPFCDHKCIYCDFYSITNYKNTSQYLEAIKTEINNRANSFDDEHKIVSIFFGGGTPSFIEPAYINEIYKLVNNRFNIASDCETTIECNPGTLTREKLLAFRETGFNRISIGVQSFDNEELKFLTRIHDSETAISNIRLAAECGFDNINVDLIFNLPGQTKEVWLKNLKTVCSLPITHISTYSLILENGTILNKMVLDGKVEMQGEDFDADLYEAGIDYLAGKGFAQYEVSNFCRDGAICRHNMNYWQRGEYLGFGTSAHSYVSNNRTWNYSALSMYIAAMEKRGEAFAGNELLNREEVLEEYIMLGLRSTGINIDLLKNEFADETLVKLVKVLNNQMYSSYMYKNENTYRLNKSGYAISDEIIRKILESIQGIL